MRRLALLILILIFFSSGNLYAKEGLRSLFLNNKAVICGINIRNFNSSDLNGNGFIAKDEISGNFINAVDRLDEIRDLGINVLHILPVTPTGKLKALGTAGSLYAIADFENINEQLIDKNSKLSSFEQIKFFIDECHKRGIMVIVDLPSCGSYDLFLKRPELFLKDDKHLSIVPADWTDVRLFNAGNNDKLNADLMQVHKNFVDWVLLCGADGIRADVATIKPYNFWKELISYTREKNSEFLYLAEASDSWREPPSEYAEFTSYDKLLEAGFDGYYGSFFNLKDWSSSEELYDHIKFNKKLLSSYNEPKSVILSFTTHDEVSPVVIHGENFSKMICWLEATLPFNPYIIDGFQSGDDYVYALANAKSDYSYTDDDTYFVHRGKLDIFNLSKKPGGNNENILNAYEAAMSFRNNNQDLITKGEFIPLKTPFNNIFAYIRSYNGELVVVIGNLSYETNFSKIKIKIPKINKNIGIQNITSGNSVRIKKGKIYTDLNPGEIKVLLIKDFSL